MRNDEAFAAATANGFGGVLMTLALASIEPEALRSFLEIGGILASIFGVFLAGDAGVNGWRIPPGGVTKRLARPELAGATAAAGGALIAVGLGVARQTDVNYNEQLERWLGFLGGVPACLAIIFCCFIWGILAIAALGSRDPSSRAPYPLAEPEPMAGTTSNTEPEGHSNELFPCWATDPLATIAEIFVVLPFVMGAVALSRDHDNSQLRSLSLAMILGGCAAWAMVTRALWLALLEEVALAREQAPLHAESARSPNAGDGHTSSSTSGGLGGRGAD